MKNLSKQEIEEKIIFLLENEFHVDRIKLTDNLRNDVDFDSVDLIELIIEYEKEFEISLENAEYYEEIVTVQDIVDLITKVITVDGGTYIPPKKKKNFITQVPNNEQQDYSLL